MPGSDTETHIEILENLVLSTSPQFVLLGWYVNDVRNDRYLRWSSIPLIPWERAHEYALRHSALYYVVGRLWVDIQYRLGLIRSEDEFLAHYLANPNSPHSRRAEMLLRRLINICRDKKVSLGIVIFPPLWRNGGDDFNLGFLLDRVLKVCAEYNMTCVDLRSAFASEHVADSSGQSVRSSSEQTCQSLGYRGRLRYVSSVLDSIRPGEGRVGRAECPGRGNIDSEPAHKSASILKQKSRSALYHCRRPRGHLEKPLPDESWT